MPMKPTHRRFLMSDLLGIANRSQAAAKSAKELRLKMEKAAESLFENEDEATANAEELESLLEEALKSSQQVIRTLKGAGMIPLSEFEEHCRSGND